MRRVKICRGCGKAFATEKARVKSCSPKCGSQVAVESKGHHKAGAYSVFCAGCGKELVCKYHCDATRVKFCRVECYRNVKEPPKDRGFHKQCPRCNRAYMTWTDKATRGYCSNGCRQKGIVSPLKGIKKLPIIERACAYCKKVFIVSRRRHDKKHCSRDCCHKSKCGKTPSAETRAKMSDASKRLGVFKRLHKDPEFQKRRLQGLIKSPNKPEELLTTILDGLYPGEYKFVGDGSFVIDGLNPDFINVNGQKKIIELFGEHFHDPNLSDKPISYRATEKGRKKTFAKFGYKTLVIWSKQIYRGGDAGRVELISRIKEFHEDRSH